MAAATAGTQLETAATASKTAAATDAKPRVVARNNAAPTMSQAEATRLAAEKKAREKTERDAKAKITLAQRDAAVARLRNEREGSKPAEDARSRTAAAAAPRPAPMTRAAVPTSQPRTVREICAGRNVIGQAVCESRECGAPEHSNEALCKQIRVNEERRREGFN